jgi:drug/metabolite transporter (DMT)-like permease
MKAQKKAYLFAFSAIAFWSTIGSAFKLSLRYLDPLWLLLISSFVACLALLAILIIQGKLPLLRTVTRKQIAMSAFLGLLNPFFYYLVLLKAYDILPAQVAGTLNYIWPLVLVLLSIPMLHQRISFISILAILISFTGILMISGAFGLTGG